MNIKILIGIWIIILVSCSNQEEQFAKEMKIMQSEVIQLPTMELLILQSNELQKMDKDVEVLKLVIYTDSVGCTSCAINQINLWNSFIDYAEQFDNRLRFYFIFSPSKKDMNSIKLAIANSMFNYPILLDTLGEFGKSNPHLPRNRAFHTFLLDEYNNVIMVGNPLKNKKIEDMFYKVVEGKLKNSNNLIFENN